MTKIELTYSQVLAAVKQLTAQERERLKVDLLDGQPAPDYLPFANTDPLWKVVGVGQGSGEPIARHHDQYLYRKAK